MTFKIKGLDSIIVDFKNYEQKNAKATKIALNEASRQGRTKSLRHAKKAWVGLRASDMKKKTSYKNATTTTLSTNFTIKAKSISLSEFGAKWKRATTTGRRTKGVSYRLKNKRRTMKGSFMAKGLVFTRKGDREDITPHFAITPTSMFETEGGVEVYTNITLGVFGIRYMKYIKDNFINT